MKKTLVALAALAATTAFAQSSVSITGQVMYGVSKSAAGVYSVGGPKGDRNYIDFSANEDLGGGIKAGAKLQNRFMPATGGQTTSYYNSADGTVASALWEQSMAYISSAALGEVKVGRFSTQLVSVNGIGHYQEDWGSGTHSGTQYGRVSGQVQYSTPVISGIQGFVIHANGEQNKYWINQSGGYNGLATDAKPTKMSDLGVYGVNYTNGGLAVQYATMSGFNNEKNSIINVGYDFGIAKVALNQFNQKNDVELMMAHKSTELGVSVPMGNWTLALTRLSNDKNVGASAVGTEVASTKRAVTGGYAKYALSKRTFFEGYISNTAQAYSAVGARSAAADGTAAYVGMAHSF